MDFACDQVDKFITNHGLSSTKVLLTYLFTQYIVNKKTAWLSIL